MQIFQRNFLKVQDFLLCIILQDVYTRMFDVSTPLTLHLFSASTKKLVLQV